MTGTADLIDQRGTVLNACVPQFRELAGWIGIRRPIRTASCRKDNLLTRVTQSQRGHGNVLAVDGS